ncbi:MAG: hypothetical protein Q4E62_10360 [Sutterellaceae bacterium]|nr:hypothetical protein [Sutterellaceae bacterium]
MSDMLWSIVSVVVLFFLYLSVLHSVRNYAKSIPISTLSEKENAPAGVTGLLLVAVGYALALGFWRLAEAANVMSFVLSSFNDDPDLTVLLAVAGPSFLAALTAFLAVQRLSGGRTPAALWQSVFLMLYSGIAHEFVLARFTNIPSDETLAAVWGVLAFLCALYLIAAPRSRNTYGLNK